MIEEITKYRTLGREFNSHREAVQFREDQLGEFLDPALGIWTPGEKLKLMHFLTDNRRHIRLLLDY